MIRRHLDYFLNRHHRSFITTTFFLFQRLDILTLCLLLFALSLPTLIYTFQCNSTLTTLDLVQPLLHTIVFLVEMALIARLTARFNSYYDERPRTYTLPTALQIQLST